MSSAKDVAVDQHEDEFLQPQNSREKCLARQVQSTVIWFGTTFSGRPQHVASFRNKQDNVSYRLQVDRILQHRPICFGVSEAQRLSDQVEKYG